MGHILVVDDEPAIIAHDDGFASDEARKGNDPQHHDEGGIAVSADTFVQLFENAAPAKEQQVAFADEAHESPSI